MHRRAGTFTDPNALGVGIGLSIPLLVAALARRGTALDAPRRGLALVALAAAPLALESSGSRTGLLLTAVIVLVGAAAGERFAHRRGNDRQQEVHDPQMLPRRGVGFWPPSPPPFSPAS